MAVMKVSKSRIRSWPKPRRLEHPEMWEAAERRIIPRAFDRRAEGLDITRRVLEAGERLGAVRLID